MSRCDVGAVRIAVLVLAAAVACSACGSSEPESTVSSGGSTSAGGKGGAQGPARPDMVAAVTPGGTRGAVDVRFALSSRPVVGQPLDIQLVLSPNVALDLLYARFQAVEGLELVKGAETEHFEHPALRTELAHTVTVVPQTDGIYYVTAVVQSDSPTESLSRTYSIPIIAGAGLADLPPVAAPRPQSNRPKP